MLQILLFRKVIMYISSLLQPLYIIFPSQMPCPPQSNQLWLILQNTEKMSSVIQCNFLPCSYLRDRLGSCFLCTLISLCIYLYCSIVSQTLGCKFFEGRNQVVYLYIYLTCIQRFVCCICLVYDCSMHRKSCQELVMQ